MSKMREVEGGFEIYERSGDNDEVHARLGEDAPNALLIFNTWLNLTGVSPVLAETYLAGVLQGLIGATVRVVDEDATA